MKLNKIIESLERHPGPQYFSDRYQNATRDFYRGFDKTITGDDSYNKKLSKVDSTGSIRLIEMSPDDYLNTIHSYFGKDLNHVYKDLSVEGVLDLLQLLKDGVLLDIPLLDFKNNYQDGRHRAIAAKLYGIKLLPVLVVESDLPKIDMSSNFTNDVSKIDSSRVVTDLDELCKSTNSNTYTELFTKLEKLNNITFKVKDDPDSDTARKKRKKTWKSVNNIIKGLFLG